MVEAGDSIVETAIGMINETIDASTTTNSYCHYASRYFELFFTENTHSIPRPMATIIQPAAMKA
ncbi:hypothetical protein VMCG_07313 [Cytospora schulzeri]|uniref:Uncharacterized protein n=1 Tax=Cytospora schulzeri TaxID=448051 RepID=A0A423WAM0_9PEZI|nr:hypothetical protein VMCG_07313 [Valsa malicola]